MRRQVAWAELGIVTAIAALVAAYLIEARGVSLDPQNLLLLQPTAWIVLILWGVIAVGCLRRPTPAEDAPRESRADILRILVMIAAFGAFIAALEYAGYDIAMCLFVLAGLLIGGERKPLPLLLFPPLFTAAAIYGFRALVPYPFPTAIL